jgi:hypothetical protein
MYVIYPELDPSTISILITELNPPGYLLERSIMWGVLAWPIHSGRAGDRY